MYSSQTIVTAVRLHFNGLSYRNIARYCGVAASTVHRWVHKLATLIRPRKQLNRRPHSKFASLRSRVQQAIQEHPFSTVAELHNCLHYPCSVSTLRRILSSLGYTYKKITWRHAPRDISQQVHAFVEAMSSVHLDDIIAVDETSFSTLNVPLHGYAQKGKRLYARQTNVQRHNFTCIMGLTSRGVTPYYLTRGSVNTSKFVDFLDSLSELPQKYVLMDNVAFHHSKLVRDKLDALGKRSLFIPPYSPEFNPIENLFSKLKNYVRKSLPSNRDTPYLQFLTSKLAGFQPSACECGNYFTHLHKELQALTYHQEEIMVI